ncbi:hypothetical protein HLK59_14900 [Streptomyces sp. S3(2020)]|uniref:hypothetical protein n=1 Tax=Streptomyces sp. S3(2020) TaxID=2732044 RepID=UPI001487C58F|nr:hypothetical protein [Streptomyces sp. S3(2020)]NNN31630.1 hypothetical protein [Streptomyces sp. S3(2020)]
MADKQYGWLDRETAERLLRGESLDNAVDAAARDDAERLAKTLGALSVEPPMSSAELPGEAAALAAFRKAHADRAPAAAALHASSATSGHTPSTDAGLIRIGVPGHRTPPPRHRRPVRLGLAAVVAFGMVGGVAVAAATGVLPKPFGKDEPRPGASVSAAVTPDRPVVSPSPDDAAQGEPSPDGSSGASPDQGSPRTDAGATPGADPGSGGHGRTGGFGAWWDGAPAACRDLRDGKQLSTDRRRALEGLAGGSTHVGKYCKGVLKTSDAQAGPGDDRKDSDQDSDNDRDGGGGQGGDDESHDGAPGGNGNGHGNGGGHHPNGGLSTPEPSPSDETTLQPKRAAAVPEPSPNPSYSAL